MKPTMHKFYTVVKGGRKGSKHNQTRKIRRGSRKPGANKIGGVRHPY